MTEFLQLCFNGLSLGARYALVALGFVVIYRATGVINFAQGGLVALGAYLTYHFNQRVELEFVPSVLIALVICALAGFFAFDRYTRYGLAMRATALDQEAALAQGISARRVFAISWGIAGIVAALAGVTLASGAAAVNPTISFIALAAFPAMILGGLDSPVG